MKKMSLLVLSLVIALPGCCGRKKESAQTVKKNNIEKYADTSGDVEYVEGVNFDDLDDAELDDAEFDDLMKDLEDYEDEDMVDEDEALMDNLSEDNEEEAFNWIDAQTDDEFKKLYFSFNHYGIRADQKNAVLYDIEQVKQLVSEAGNSQPTVVIEGHTDQEGSRLYNIALSEKRAATVADLFVAAGVDKNLIKVVGRGQECPTMINGKVVNGSREDRAPNRRVEVRVIYT